MSFNSHRNLTDSLVTNLFEGELADSLMSLQLEYNMLAAFDSNLLRPLVKLRHLSLRSNNLKSFDLAPVTKKLSILELGHNRLEQFPSASDAASLDERNIARLNLEKNRLLHVDLQHFPQLKDIDLNENLLATPGPTETEASIVRVSGIRAFTDCLLYTSDAADD